MRKISAPLNSSRVALRRRANPKPSSADALQIKIWNDAQRRARDMAAVNTAVEIIAKFESACKFFASFSTYFLGGLGEFQRLASEKIGKMRILSKSPSG
jgi:hypothetical protein